MMRRWLGRAVLLAGCFLVSTGHARADWNEPVDEQEQLRCASAELRLTDQLINGLYGDLRGRLEPEAQKLLLAEQRAWLRSRDVTCGLDNRIGDREEWFRALEAVPAKMTCVIRFTTERNIRLSDWLKAAEVRSTNIPAPPSGEPTSSPASSTAPQPSSSGARVTDDELARIYAYDSTIMRRSGKWYYEIEVKAGLIAQQSEVTFDYGVAQNVAPGGGGWLIRIRRSLAAQRDLIYYIGVAVDLDEGFIYSRSQGQWRVNPGEVGGFPIKPRIDTIGRIGGSSDMRPLLDQHLVRVNFGSRPFQYAVPDGYWPFDAP